MDGSTSLRDGSAHASVAGISTGSQDFALSCSSHPLFSLYNSWKEGRLPKASMREVADWEHMGYALPHLWSSGDNRRYGRSIGSAVDDCGRTPVVGHVEPRCDVVEYWVADPWFLLSCVSVRRTFDTQRVSHDILCLSSRVEHEVGSLIPPRRS